MKNILFLFVLFTSCTFAQVQDYNLRIGSGKDPDSTYCLLTATTGSNFAGRGQFKSLPQLATLLQPYISAAADYNFAEDNLLFTGDRTHDVNQHALTIENFDLLQFLGNLQIQLGITTALKTNMISVNDGSIDLSSYGNSTNGRIIIDSSKVELRQTNGRYVLNTNPPSGASTDSILTINAATGAIRMIDQSSLSVDDSGFVHKTGDETISDNKTFVDSTRFNDPIITYNENFSNLFALTETSQKNLTGDGYMAHRRIDYDSLAYPALNDAYGRFGEWIEVSSWDSTINVGFENGGNLLHDIGFNLDQSSPLYNPKRPSYKKSIEQGYYPGLGNTLWVEGHEEVTDTLGRITRPFDWAAAYDGSYAAFSTTSDRSYVYKSPDQALTGENNWENVTYTTGVKKLNYNQRTQIDKKYTGVLLEKYSNLISTPTYRNIITHDSDDDLWIGDSTGIDITNKLNFRINSYTTPIIKSNNYTLRFDTITVDFLGQGAGSRRNFLLSTPGDADKIGVMYDGSVFQIGKYNANEAIFRINQAASNYALNIASDSKIRINMNAGYGGIDFTQFSDDLAGGWMTRDAATSYYVGQYIDPSNDWVINHNGTEKFKFKTSGEIFSSGLILSALPVYADEAAAVTAGLAQNTVYKTATGELRIKL